MIGILSIDFDYFIDVSSQERDLYFPNGSDEIPSNKLLSLWKEKYLLHPELKKIGVIEDFYFIKNFLKDLKISKDNFGKNDNHKYIKNLIDSISKLRKIRIVNIDFHHDYYHYYYGGENCNCGNWLRRVMEERPDTKVKWIRRKDSQIYSLDGIVPFEHTEDIKSICNENFDYVFLCKSPAWSPTHLNHKFEELASSVSMKLSKIS